MIRLMGFDCKGGSKIRAALNCAFINLFLTATAVFKSAIFAFAIAFFVCGKVKKVPGRRRNAIYLIEAKLNTCVKRR